MEKGQSRSKASRQRGMCVLGTRQPESGCCKHSRNSTLRQVPTCAQVQETAELPDPCPLPSTIKRRSLNDKDRLIYAPMADVGGLLFDKDAVYIDIPDWKVSCEPAASDCPLCRDSNAQQPMLMRTQTLT